MAPQNTTRAAHPQVEAASPSTPTTMLSLPMEIIERIAHSVDVRDSDDIHALSRVCKGFYHACIPIYHKRVVERHPYILNWATAIGRLDLMKRFLKAGVDQKAKIRDPGRDRRRPRFYPPGLTTLGIFFWQYFRQPFDSIFVPRQYRGPARETHRLRRARPEDRSLTPLSIAVYQGNYEALSLLCRHNPDWMVQLDPRLLDIEGEPNGLYWRLSDMAFYHKDEDMLLKALPAMQATALRHLAVVYWRLTLKRLIDRDFLRVAAFLLEQLPFDNNHYMILGDYIFHGADVNERWRDFHNLSAMQHAFRLSLDQTRRPDFFADWAALLANYGANVDEDQGVGHTLLIEACYIGCFDQARVLLSVGASPVIAFSRAGLHVAARAPPQGGEFHIGSHGNGLPVIDFTPLEIACLPYMHGWSYGLLTYKASHGARSEARHQAWQASRLAFIRAIAPTLEDARGQTILRTALSIAAELRDVDVVSALLEAGAGLTGGSELSWGRMGMFPPLVVALLKSKVFRHQGGRVDAERTARLLLESGADVRDLQYFPGALWNFEVILGVSADDYRRPV
ncbi:hypothetical protein BDP81DRAFT_496772 [Colletotrichum phormii]|uniref:F-box domain-containing protein n=1 Tax=Colletotrichum phormii TaxID=359342 RepID=A0AAJ0EJK3_9PEZI|nr:uncharacterized protein BDP81DRAFT_496772 [Colletotrichum phormii]KAK1654121.1 hypothetical protein BDP81DRAFT_496772 [Colletotrichum phormii]